MPKLVNFLEDRYSRHKANEDLAMRIEESL